MTHEGKLVEQIRYSANGVPFNIPLGDINADGKVKAADEDQHKDLDTNGPYHIRGNFDLDSDIDAADNAIVTAKNTNTTGRGYLTLRNNDHRIMQPGVEFGGSNLGLAYGQTGQSAVHLTISILINKNITKISKSIRPFPNPNVYYIGGSLLVSDCIGCCRSQAEDNNYDSDWEYQCDTHCRTVGPLTPLTGPDIRCATEAVRNPSRVSSGICDEYPVDYNYSGSNARCFCQCTGDSNWSQIVRSCLSYLYFRGVDGRDAHVFCYVFANWMATDRDDILLAQCLLKCTVGHRIIIPIVPIFLPPYRLPTIPELIPILVPPQRLKPYF